MSKPFQAKGRDGRMRLEDREENTHSCLRGCRPVRAGELFLAPCTERDSLDDPDSEVVRRAAVAGWAMGVEG